MQQLQSGPGPALDARRSTEPRAASQAAAFQLAALLENYEDRIEELTSGWPDADSYASIGRDMHQMRLCSACLPLLSVPWLHVLISHAELVHCLWQCRAVGTQSPELAQCKTRHLAAVRALREQCQRHFSRRAAARPTMNLPQVH